MSPLMSMSRKIPEFDFTPNRRKNQPIHTVKAQSTLTKIECRPRHSRARAHVLQHSQLAYRPDLRHGDAECRIGAGWDQRRRSNEIHCTTGEYAPYLT